MEFFLDIWKLSYISQLNTIYDPTWEKYIKKDSIGQLTKLTKQLTQSIDKIDT